MAFRLDKGSISKRRRGPDGSLRADAAIGRAGVQTYRNHDGSIRREYRPPEEVFHPDAMASFALVTVTDDHPPGPITEHNAKTFGVGTMGESIRRDTGDVLAGTIVVRDAATLKKVEAGKLQLSCGYTCDEDWTAGVTPRGEPYDLIQRNIRGNHVAIVDVGRAGPSVSIRMDAAEMIDTTPDKESHMDPAALQARIIELMASNATEKARADAAEKSLAEASGKLAAESARADAAEKARTDSASGPAFEARVNARVDLLSTARTVLGAEYKVDGVADLDLQLAVRVEVGERSAEEVGEEQVDVARVDAAAERVVAASRAQVIQPSRGHRSTRGTRPPARCPSSAPRSCRSPRSSRG
jgi:hypothetical protein